MVYPDVLSQKFEVVVRKVLVQDELQDAVVIHAEVGDGPSYEIKAESLLQAIGDLATAAASDATQDEAIAWAEQRADIRRELLQWHAGKSDEGFLTLLERLCPREEG